MTNDAFLAALALCKDKFVWEVSEDGYAIRGYGNLQYPGMRFCPWTALAAVSKHQWIPVSQYRSAAKLFGVPGKKADRLATVADWGYSATDYRAATLRVRLLACLGLQEISDEEISDE